MARLGCGAMLLAAAPCAADLGAALADLKGQEKVDCSSICDAVGGTYRGYGMRSSGAVADYDCNCGDAGTVTVECTGSPFQECCQDKCENAGCPDTAQGWECPADGGCVGGDTSACDGDDDWDAWVAAHNIYRCMHDIPSVSWNPAMYADTKDHFEGMSEMEHSDCYNLPPPVGPAGENLYWSSASFPPFAAVSSWYGEIADCDSLPGCPSSGMVGHFTAMEWQGGQQIGCYANDQNLAACRYKGLDFKGCKTPNFGSQDDEYVKNVYDRVKTFEECAALVKDCGLPVPETTDVDAETGLSTVLSAAAWHSNAAGVLRVGSVAVMVVAAAAGVLLATTAWKRLPHARSTEVPEGSAQE